MDLVSLNAESVCCVVQLVRQNQATIAELYSLLKEGVRQGGGWPVVEAMMAKRTQFSAVDEDEEDFEKRRQEAKKKLKQEGALGVSKTPRRKAARSASRGRNSRKRSPSSSPPASSSTPAAKPKGACFKCASTKHQARDCPMKNKKNVKEQKGGKR